MIILKFYRFTGFGIFTNERNFQNQTKICEKVIGRTDERRPCPMASVSGGRLWGGGKSRRSGAAPAGYRSNSQRTSDTFSAQCSSGSGREALRLPRQERLRNAGFSLLPTDARRTRLPSDTAFFLVLRCGGERAPGGFFSRRMYWLRKCCR